MLAFIEALDNAQVMLMLIIMIITILISMMITMILLQYDEIEERENL